MTDLEMTQKITEMIDFAYERTFERMDAIEGAPHDQIGQTMIMDPTPSSYLMAYLNYYSGCFDGMLFGQFLEEFDRMPTLVENAFIKETMRPKFEGFKLRIRDIAETRCRQDGYW